MGRSSGRARRAPLASVRDFVTSHESITNPGAGKRMAGNESISGTPLDNRAGGTQGLTGFTILQEEAWRT
jgi:hypothetical protein